MGIPGNQVGCHASVKVMVAFGPQTFNLLESEAKERGISIQELLRAVIIPEWFRVQDVPEERAAGTLRARLEPRENSLSNNSRPGNHRL